MLKGGGYFDDVMGEPAGGARLEAGGSKIGLPKDKESVIGGGSVPCQVKLIKKR